MVQRLVCRLILGHYNNTLNKLTKTDKLNTIQYYVYDYQGRRVRTVIESDQKTQSQRRCCCSANLKCQCYQGLVGYRWHQSHCTHILSESSKDNTQIHYQLNSHLQSNTLQ
jgi:hypothetical protein